VQRPSRVVLGRADVSRTFLNIVAIPLPPPPERYHGQRYFACRQRQYVCINQRKGVFALKKLCFPAG